ncbi:PQQ-binding-like beta-propeller repeat protein [Halococcoides cellulosivorans]|uniref:PQQ-binding-like beta-propeller repeat protein n=1 Tax=Halococcoides cellulosivorans TaxID=1679096 RepID=UPI00131ED9DB|nr:PQQ-binding-like beta-propeller repeat protein [Halococcoides cellulosivorans]
MSIQAEHLEDWPMHRGDPGHSGTRTPSFAASETPTVAWEHRGPGTFPTALLPTTGALFVQAYPWMVRLFDPATGEMQTGYELPDEDDRIVRGGALVDGTLYIGTWDSVTAFEASTGRTVWSRRVGEASFETYSEPIGGRATPAIVDDALYVHGAISGEWGLYALDRDDGETRWRQPLPGGEPTDPVPAGETIVVANRGTGDIHALDRTDGTLQWTANVPPRRTQDERVGTTTPIVHRESVCVPTGAGTVRAFAAETGEAVWEYDLGTETPPARTEWYLRATYPLAARDGRVYVGGSDGQFHAIDVASGEAVWTLSADGRAYWTTPAVTHDAVYVGNANARTDESGNWQLGTDGRLSAVDAATGRELWTREYDGYPIDPVVGETGVFAGFVTPEVDEPVRLIKVGPENA